MVFFSNSTKVRRFFFKMYPSDVCTSPMFVPVRRLYQSDVCKSDVCTVRPSLAYDVCTDTPNSIRYQPIPPIHFLQTLPLTRAVYINLLRFLELLRFWNFKKHHINPSTLHKIVRREIREKRKIRFSAYILSKGTHLAVCEKRMFRIKQFLKS